MDTETQPLIHLDTVSKVFYTDDVETHALDAITLDICHGEYIAIEGPSGCGKSTLLSILGLLDTPTDGSYTLHDRPVAQLKQAERARTRNREIGFIFQSFNLIGDLTPRLMVYLPYSQAWAPMHTVLATTTMNPEQTAQALLTAGREVDPDLWVWETKTMERHLGIMRLPARLSAFILSVFAMLALALATIGFYGVVSYAVTQRTREVGIRMALGADAARIVRLLVSSGLRLVLVGTGIGLVTSLALVRLSSGLVFGGATFDPLTFVAVTLVLGLTGFVAAYLPARRAARFHPVTALRAR